MYNFNDCDEYRIHFLHGNVIETVLAHVAGVFGNYTVYFHLEYVFVYDKSINIEVIMLYFVIS